MKKALIDFRIGRVCQIEDEEDIFPVDPRALIWVDAINGLTTEHTYINEVFVDPVVEPEPTESEKAAEAIGRTNKDMFEAFESTIEYLLKNGMNASDLPPGTAGLINSRKADRLKL